MRDWICGFFMAWGMFLAIPCPRKIWSESARQKMLVCMPLVGLLAGGVWAGAWLLMRGAPGPVRAAVCAAAPWLVTGFMCMSRSASGWSQILVRICWTSSRMACRASRTSWSRETVFCS